MPRMTPGLDRLCSCLTQPPEALHLQTLCMHWGLEDTAAQKWHCSAFSCTLAGFVQHREQGSISP